MTRFTVEVDVVGDPTEASRVIGSAIDSGVLQYCVNDAGDVRVERATVTEERELDKKLTRFTVEIEVDGARAEAAEALDDALDDGVFQNLIDSHGVTVESAVVVFEQEVRV